jgi:hypothetical protein
MKQVKFFMIAAAIFVGITFDSCLNSENENAWDGYDYVTIEESAWGGYITLLGDFSGCTFIPSNPSLLQSQTNEYPERARIFYKLAKDEVITEGKTEYKIEIVSCDLLLPVKDFSRTEDTGGPTPTPLIQLDAQNTWAVNDYINIGFTFHTNGKTTVQNFDLFAESVESNTLHVKLNHSEEDVVANYESQGLISFRIPSFTRLSEIYSSLDLSNILIPFGENKDSIYIKVTAEGDNNRTLELNPIRVKIRN